MDFDIGSNIYRNALSSIEVDGLWQFSFEYNRRYNEMMLKGLIFDQNGTMTAKLSENSLSFNVRGEYEIVSDPVTVKVLHRENRKVILEVTFQGRDRVQIHNAHLYTGKGHTLEITPTFWKINGKTHTHESMDCQGESLRLE
jgi:hydroxymethylpyrimidine pyrophosphatase-like HAD family hydrolase